MNIPDVNVTALIAVIIGIFSIGAYIANLLGKRKARGEIPLQSQVTDSQVSEWRSHTTGHSASSTSHIVKTVFNVPVLAALSHTRHFGTRIDANNWSTRFATGTWHPVFPHPYSKDEVFLQEELLTHSYTPLVVGIGALIIGGLALCFG